MVAEMDDETKFEVALALILLRDFRRSDAGQKDGEVVLRMLELSKQLEVAEEYQTLLSKVPPLEIKERRG